MKYQAIILVLASSDESLNNTRFLIPRMKDEWKPLYPYFKKIWEQYMFTNPNIKVLFVYGGDSNIDKKDYDLIYEDVFENLYPGMIKKTLYAMRDIDNTYEYDFLIRTNLSTFWDLNKLSLRLNNLPKEKFLGGRIVHALDPYVAGFNMVMSRDLIKSVLPFTDDIIKENLLEDLSLTLAFKKYANVEILTNERDNEIGMSMGDVYNEKLYNTGLNIYKNKSLDHFRAKSRLNRNFDKETHKRLLLEIYGKTI